MQVALLEIQNFRGVRTGKVQFREHTVLIGPNNSSKTTIVEALALVRTWRLVRNLTEHDFFGSNPQPADRIKIVATVIGFEPEDFTVHTEWFRDGRAVPVWFDPQSGAVVAEQMNGNG